MYAYCSNNPVMYIDIFGVNKIECINFDNINVSQIIMTVLVGCVLIASAGETISQPRSNHSMGITLSIGISPERIFDPVFPVCLDETTQEQEKRLPFLKQSLFFQSQH